MNAPIVTVVVPVYNRGPLVRATVNSVLAQTIPAHECEIVIVDDGSTDETLEGLQREYGSNEQVRIFTQQNAGVAAARNRGLWEAHGEFISYLDHDDIWLPEKLELQLHSLRENPTADVVYCRWIDVNENHEPLPKEQQTAQHYLSAPPIGNVYHHLIRRNFIVSMSIPLIRTAALRAINGCDPRTVPCDDWDLWLRLAHRSRFMCLSEALVLYTRHAAQQSQDVAEMAYGMYRTLIKHWPHVLGKPNLFMLTVASQWFYKTVSLYTRAKQMLICGEFDEAKRLVKRVALRHPLALLSPQWIYLIRRLMSHNSAPY